MRKIFKDGNFEAWFQWIRNCKGKDLTKYTKGCFDNMSTLDSLETTSSTQDGYKKNANEMREHVHFGLIIAAFAIYYMLIN